MDGMTELQPTNHGDIKGGNGETGRVISWKATKGYTQG